MWASTVRVSAQTPSSPPRDARVLNETVDAAGNRTRTIQYIKGGKKVTETINIPRLVEAIKTPINRDTLLQDSLLILVTKSAGRLELYYRKHLIRSYKAVFGPKPLENKLIEGDRRTPEGRFSIVSKKAGSHYNKFLLLNYPNDSTTALFEALKQKGLLKPNARPGGAVGIHGVWRGGDDLIDKGVGWTDGCIALKNKDVDELYTLVDAGCRVLIRK